MAILGVFYRLVCVYVCVCVCNYVVSRVPLVLVMDSDRCIGSNYT